MRARYSKYFLFLVVGFLMFIGPFVVKAQRKPASNLADSEWSVITKSWYESLTGTPVNVIYRFHSQGKVGGTLYYVLLHTPLAPDQPLNPVAINPTVQSYPFYNGSYQQSKNTVAIWFNDHSIEGVIRGNRIEATLTVKSTGSKSRWEAELVSKKSEYGGDMIAQNPSEAPKPKAFSSSMNDRFPKSINGFARADFTSYFCTRGREIDIISGGCNSADGVVEQANAKYGGVDVWVRKYQDSSRATAALSKEIQVVPASLFYQRDNIKNRDGKVVGNMYVLQTKDGKSREMVLFTYDSFFYTLESLSLGEAQQIKNRLPLW